MSVEDYLDCSLLYKDLVHYGPHNFLVWGPGLYKSGKTKVSTNKQAKIHAFIVYVICASLCQQNSISLGSAHRCWYSCGPRGPATSWAGRTWQLSTLYWIWWYGKCKIEGILKKSWGLETFNAFGISGEGPWYTISGGEPSVALMTPGY